MSSGSAIAVVKGLGSVSKAVSISTTSAQPPAKGVYIGEGDTYYFFLDGAYVKFANTIAGSILPIRPTKVASDSGGTSPVDAGDILFLY
jgi:hypothetical protein